ncbi:hypothetical protein ACFVYV_09390 [Streptomyces mirabilis]|uniref:hypothetical protein n=1 Tax=Streptomyces mirabilis TaxID=68239 RepID=UPI0036DC58B3
MPLAPPTSFTATTGGFITAALWNAQVRDATAFFTAPPSFRAHSEVAQAIPNNAWTAINLETEEFDNYGGHSTSTNTSRYTCQLAGYYLITACAAFNGTVSTANTRATRVQLNNTSSLHGSFAKAPAANNAASSALHSACIAFLQVGDFVEVQGNQDSGVSVNTSATSGDVTSSLTVLWVSN